MSTRGSAATAPAVGSTVVEAARAADRSHPGAATAVAHTTPLDASGSIPGAVACDTAVAIPAAAAPEGVRRGLSAVPSPAAPRFAAFAGRLGEISGTHATAALTLAFRLVLEAQRRGEPVAWIIRGDGLFFPPDVAEASVDLDALVVVRAPEALPAARAADRLVRSGGFGLVVLDLGAGARVPPPALTRLAGLAQRHHAAVVCLTDKSRERPSVGSLVSIRVEAVRVRHEGDLYCCEARALKDKRRGPGWMHREVCRGPDGLR